MNRETLKFLVTLALLLATLAPLQAAETPTAKPNLVVILADDT